MHYKNSEENFVGVDLAICSLTLSERLNVKYFAFLIWTLHIGTFSNEVFLIFKG